MTKIKKSVRLLWDDQIRKNEAQLEYGNQNTRSIAKNSK
jgi:hypothetical protein